MQEGVELTDSIAWCAHKVMGAPLHASVILYKDKDALRSGFDCHTPYIYQVSDDIPSDTQEFDAAGKYTFQCSRPVDATKVWFIWRHLGSVGFEKKVDHAFDMAAELVRLIESDEYPNFRLAVKKPEFTNVCFYFLPDSMMHQFDDPEIFKLQGENIFAPIDSAHPVGTITSSIRAEMVKQGRILMGYSSLSSFGGVPSFFRFVAVSLRLQPEHLTFSLNHLKEIGNAIDFK